ncbi:MAG TPA: AAA family ATPase, partial [Chloroflexota bacterium]|nr:AAA family ATPase [Chloroflexota bacterium]
MNPQSLPSGPLSATAERARVLTFLIADVRGYTRFTLEHGDEAAACLAMRFADLVEGAVTRHDGRVVELRGDEALAVFESARDALRAALDLNLRLESEPLYEVEGKPALGIGIGVGVDAGEAVAVAGGYRGAALNLAARLCGLAGSGEVLVSDTVTNLARKVEGIEYVRRGAAQLKGFIEPVTVFRAQAKHDDQAEPDPRGLREREDNLSHGLDGQIQSARDLPIAGFLGSLPGGVLAGRSRELERLLQLVDEVEKGSGRLIMLAGEPGAGKTRLAQEVTLHLRDRGFLIAGGSCSETRETSPFSPFVDVLARLFSLCPPDIREATAAQWPALARIIPGLGSAEHDRVSEPVDQDRL